MAEMGQFETIPNIEIWLVTYFDVVFLHYHQPKIKLELISIVTGLEVLTNLEGLVEDYNA